MFGWIHICLPITDPKLPGAIIYLCPELAVCMNNGIIPGRNQPPLHDRWGMMRGHKKDYGGCQRRTMMDTFGGCA
jgi:hypothetical protein